MRLNLTIRARLIASLVLLMSLTLGLGGFCYYRLSAVRVAVVDLSDNALPSARILGRMATNFETVRSRQLAFMLSPPERRVESLGRLRTSMTNVEADLKEYARFVIPEEAALWKAVQNTVPAYVKMGEEFLRLLGAGDEIAARGYLLDGMLAGVNAGRDAIKAEIQFNDVLGRKAGETANALGDSAQTAIIVVLGLIVALTLAISWMAIATVSRPVHRMAGVMHRVAKGDLSGEVPNAGERSEIGEMAGALQVFKDNISRTRLLEEETALARASAEEQRKRAMRDMADGFEAAVGSVITMVSTSATELQATAQTMTATAGQTASQSVTVAAARRGGRRQRQHGRGSGRGAWKFGPGDQPPGLWLVRPRPDGGGRGQRDHATRPGAEPGLGPHRRHGRADRQHRQPDQPARAQRHHRAGPRR